jgi:hypothetical protein
VARPHCQPTRAVSARKLDRCASADGRRPRWDSSGRPDSSFENRKLTGQVLDAQLVALTAVGVEPGRRMFTDNRAGSAKTARPGLAAMFDYARPGDTVVAAIDRLGRTVTEVTPHHHRPW